MIDLYTWKTPNGRKISIMLEECNLEYTVHPVDLSKGEEFKPEFIALNPNCKIPVIVDREGPAGQPYTMVESGAILMYLAEKSGRFLPMDTAGKYEVIQWLMFEMAGVGPIFGQLHHFYRVAPEPAPYAIERFDKETRRVYGLLDHHFADHEYLAHEISIADFDTLPWIARHPWHKVDINDFPNVKRWHDKMMSRPAVERGMNIIPE